jgi:hypothetical protein
VVSQNLAVYGGGIMNKIGTLTIQNGSVIGGAGTANRATYEGGGIYAYPGSTTTIDASTVSANTAVYGGGIFNTGNNGIVAMLIIQNGSVIGGVGAGNSATTSGGGILNNIGATVIIDASTVSANAASVGGGGIYNYATMTITNSRILGNTATSTGGGLYNSSTSTISVTGSCVVGNSSAAFRNDNNTVQTATGNWWGDPGGPGVGSADAVSGNWNTSGFLTSVPAVCVP